MTELEKKLEDALRKSVLELKIARGKLAAQNEPIAVIGMSCRFPGGADSPEAYWNLLHQGVNGISEVPPDRWDVDAYYDPNPDAPGKMITRKAGFIKNVDLFDAEFFGISPREAQAMDPQQRLLLEVVWEALERAGIPSLSLENSQTGVFIGASFSDYFNLMQGADFKLFETYTALGGSLSALNGRISYFLGLLGPSLTVDTACSSSLVSTHLACVSLQRGESNLAIAGGANLILSPALSIMLSRAKMLAPDGYCKTFDASGNGYARGEGIGVLILKRLSDAKRDNDPILAIIRASAVDQDGPSAGLTVPNGVAQASLINQALKSAELHAKDVTYVEAHGTGTQLGDPIEVGAIQEAYGKDRGSDNVLYLGSAKSNIGHLEAAAGIAGLIKVILALNHEIIPPNLHLKELNPKIHLDSIPAKIITEPTSWKGEKLLAGISSFGFTGTNAHLILEKAPPRTVQPTEKKFPAYILPLSAKTKDALDRLIAQYGSFLNQTKDSIADICYTASVGRNHDKYRAAFVAKDLNELKEKVKKRDSVDGETSMVTPELELANQYVKGGSVDWKGLFSGCQPQKILLPTYPFERNRYWSAAAKIASSPPQEEMLSDWFYEWGWEKQALTGKKISRTGQWLILGNDEILSDHFANMFKGKARVIKCADIPDSKEGFAKLIDGSVGIVDLSSVGMQGEDLTKSSRRYLHLAQAVVEKNEINRIPFWFVTQYADRDLLTSPINGLHKTFVQEYPDGPAVHVDIDGEEDSLNLLFAEIQLEAPDEKFVRYRKGDRFVGRFRHKIIELPEKMDLTGKITGEGSYLITGGLGGLGITLAGWLVKNGATDLILTSRRPPSASAESAIKALQNNGVSIAVIEGDVSERGAVDKILQTISEKHKSLKGIFHLAGVLDDKAFMKQTDESLEKVFAPKAYGAYFLHEQTAKLNLDLFVLFSSTAATIGNPGQANYAAANAFLDGLASYRIMKGLPALSLAWGPWAEVGMAASLASRHHKMGWVGIPPNLGLKIIGLALQIGLIHLSVSKIRWAVFLKQVPVLPKWLSDFKNEMPVQSSHAAFDTVETGQLKEFIKLSIIDISRYILGLDESARLDEDKNFFDMGMDSLMAIEFKTQLQALTSEKIKISNNAIYDYPDIAKLTDHIFSFYEQKDTAAKLVYPADLYEDADLGDAITPAAQEAKFPPENLFFTGVTGHLGSYLLNKCALQFKDAKLYCLVRAATTEEGLARVIESLQSRSIKVESFQDRIRIVLGDLAQPGLGIQPDEYETLSREIDLIFHCGAQTNWSYSYEMLKPANVGGTLEVIKFAAMNKRKRIHHISTIGVLPYFKTDRYQAIAENFDILHKAPLVLPYGQSKWVSEMQMHHARERGLKVNIYRPGQLVCDLENGVPVWSEYSYRVVEGCLQLKYAPEANLEISMTPVDVTAEIVAKIAFKDQMMDQNFNIANPNKVSAKSILKELMNKGVPLEFVSTEEWIEKLKALDIHEDKNPILPVLDLLVDSLSKEITDKLCVNTVREVTGENIDFPTREETIINAYIRGYKYEKK